MREREWRREGGSEERREGRRGKGRGEGRQEWKGGSEDKRERKERKGVGRKRRKGRKEGVCTCSATVAHETNPPVFSGLLTTNFPSASHSTTGNPMFSLQADKSNNHIHRVND